MILRTFKFLSSINSKPRSTLIKGCSKSSEKVKSNPRFGKIKKSSVLNFIFSPKNPDPEKLSAYECGFEPFDDSRMEFDVRFYLVAILFIIFDLEIAFLFPWAISLGNIGLLGFCSMMIFLFILTIGFIYEWKKGALDWE